MYYRIVQQTKHALKIAKKNNDAIDKKIIKTILPQITPQIEYQSKEGKSFAVIGIPVEVFEYTGSGILSHVRCHRVINNLTTVNGKLDGFTCSMYHSYNAYMLRFTW